MISQDIIKALDAIKVINPYITPDTYKIYEKYIKLRSEGDESNIMVRVTEDLYALVSSTSWHRKFNVKSADYSFRWTLEKPIYHDDKNDKCYIYGMTHVPISVIQQLLITDLGQYNYNNNIYGKLLTKHINYSSDSELLDRYNIKTVAVRQFRKGEVFFLKNITALQDVWITEKYKSTAIYGALVDIEGIHILTGFIAPFLEMVTHRDAGSDLLGKYI